MIVRNVQLLALLTLLFPPLAYAADIPSRIITIEADSWCPINCEPGSKPGIGIELAKKAFEPLGYTVNYVIVPWSQALQDVRSGKADAVVGANTHDDKTLIFPDNAIYTMSDDFYVLSGNPWRYQGVHTFKGKRVGAIEDYGYGDIVSQFIDQNKANVDLIQKVSGADGLQQNIAKLTANKIDIIIESKPVMDYTLRKMGMEDKFAWAGGVPQDPVYVAFSPAKPASRALAQHYDNVVNQLRASNALETMYGAYGLRP